MFVCYFDDGGVILIVDEIILIVDEMFVIARWGV